MHPIYRFEDPPELVGAIIPKCLIAGWRATRDLLSGFEVALEERGHEVVAAVAAMGDPGLRSRLAMGRAGGKSLAIYEVEPVLSAKRQAGSKRIL